MNFAAPDIPAAVQRTLVLFGNVDDRILNSRAVLFGIYVRTFAPCDKKQELSWEEMAKLLDIDANTLIQMESSILPSELKFDALVKVSKKLDIDLYQLFLPFA